MEVTIFAVFAVILSVTTLAPLSRSETWWIRALDFPRLQIGSCALLLLVLQYLLLERSLAFWVLSGIALCCLLYQAWWILPYTRLSRVEALDAAAGAPENRIRILTSNVLGGNRNSEGLLRLVREYDPDLLLTLESGEWWQKALEVLEEKYCHTVKCPLENLYGMHLYSRLPLTECSVEYLLEDDIPSIHTAIELRSGAVISAHFVHPRPPSPPESDCSTERDAELVVVGKKVAETDSPVIVAGDLNDVAWSRTTRLFRKISGLLDPRVGRGMFNTFHACHWFLRWPLDHLFLSRHFTVARLHLLPAFGSDHFPLFAELVYNDAPVNAPGKLEASAEDHAQADEKLADKPVDTSDVPDPGT